MKMADGLRNDAVLAALDEAIRGKVDNLYKHLAMLSGLPGTRMNVSVAQGFATECARKGRSADDLLFKMALLDAEEAPGNTASEFFPVCGVMGLGARAAGDSALVEKAVPLFHEAAEDLRFRVREAVPYALARIGGDALVHDVAGWTDGYFQAAAVLMGLADSRWLDTIDDHEAALARLDESFQLAKNAPRSAIRYPGHKALVEALSIAPAAMAMRFGVPVFALLASWTSTEIPELRETIVKTIKATKLAGRHAADIQRVRKALEDTTAKPRDPNSVVPGMRSRGKKHNKR